MTEQYIEEQCEKFDIEYYDINDDMSIDVDEDVYIRFGLMSKLPINFNIVYGDFICNQITLKTLKGCPKEIHGDFDASSNRLKDLQYCPKYVEGCVFLYNNQINNLKHFFLNTGRLFLSENNIRTFDNLSDRIFDIRNNPVNPLWDLFQDKKYINYFNELDIITPDEKSIILDRLNYFLIDIGKSELEILSKDESAFKDKYNNIHYFENYNIIY